VHSAAQQMQAPPIKARNAPTRLWSYIKFKIALRKGNTVCHKLN
jgi:hypothetical protein